MDDQNFLKLLIEFKERMDYFSGVIRALIVGMIIIIAMQFTLALWFWLG